jgi:PAS domain S-box-containing protein
MRTLERPERYDLSLTDDRRYRLLVEAITDYAIYMLDPQGRIASWNHGARRFKGYEAEEIIGEHFSRFYSKADQLAGLPSRALRTAAHKGKFEGEGWRIRKDGSRFWAHVVIDPIHDDAGNLVGYVKITRDLTERKRAEEDLKRSEEQFRILVQGVTDYAIYMLDPQGYVTNWNSGAERLKGYRPEEIVGQHYSQFYTEEDRSAGLPATNLEIATKAGKLESEGWRIRKDGSRFWASVVIDPIRNEMGELIGFAKVTRDVTEKRDVQLALEQAREALFQSQKLEALGQLTGGVAHDFNNILMAIQSGLELVRKNLKSDPKSAALIDNALLAIQRSATLTQRMLMFARRQKLSPETVDIQTLVRDMTELLQRSLTPTIRIETQFPLALPLVLVDPNQLESAILNLVINARDAMPHGGKIVIAARTENHERVCLSVIDTGEGMDEETLKRAVEPFFTTKGIGKGTGLGLSMVQGFAAESGGRLAIKSKKGAGTTAEIILPVAQRQAEPAASAPEQPEETPQQLGRLVVLAVDDDPLVLLNTEAMLEDLGHKVLSATSGSDALALLADGERVDVVVTDQAMPNMTGLQLAQVIQEEWPTVPVIVATGYAELPAGWEGTVTKISKPYLQGELAKALNDVFAHKAPQTRP